MKKKKPQVPKIIKKCKFCQIFWEIPRKHWELVSTQEGKILKVSRKCPMTSTQVTKDDGCEKLELASYIRCKKWEEQIPTLACLDRQRTGQCRNCKQGKELKELYRELNPPKPIVIPKKYKPIRIPQKTEDSKQKKLDELKEKFGLK